MEQHQHHQPELRPGVGSGYVFLTLGLTFAVLASVHVGVAWGWGWLGAGGTGAWIAIAVLIYRYGIRQAFTGYGGTWPEGHIDADPEPEPQLDDVAAWAREDAQLARLDRSLRPLAAGALQVLTERVDHHAGLGPAGGGHLFLNRGDQVLRGVEGHAPVVAFPGVVVQAGRGPASPLTVNGRRGVSLGWVDLVAAVEGVEDGEPTADNRGVGGGLTLAEGPASAHDGRSPGQGRGRTPSRRWSVRNG